MLQVSSTCYHLKVQWGLEILVIDKVLLLSPPNSVKNWDPNYSNISFHS